MNKTGISWTDFTWNPWSGCVKVSPGCKHCYAHTSAENKRGTKSFPNGFDLTVREHKFNEPLKLKEPSLIFVNSMSDFFLESVSDELRDRIVDIMEQTPQHQYQVLTKRHHEMLRYSKRRKLPSNFWAGVSVESQDYISRMDVLREVDVEIRFISAEPLLSSLDLNLEDIHWVIAGGETLNDPKERAKRALVDYDPKTKKWTPRQDRYHWIADIRDQCINAGVPFFFKQWGGFQSKSAGSLLDDRTWEEYPRKPGYSEKSTVTSMPLEEPKPTEIVDGEFPASSADVMQQRLRVLAEDIRLRIKRSASDIYHIGVYLMAAQSLLVHGEFLPWIKAEFGMGRSAAYKFINVAKAFQGKFPQNGNLKIAASALYLLASSDTPKEAQDEALERAATGETISPHVAKEIVERHSSTPHHASVTTLLKPELTHLDVADTDVCPVVSPTLVSLPTTPLTRIENDFYPTNALLTKALFAQVNIAGQILEPCAGDGAIASELPSGCITNELFPREGYECNYKLDATNPQAWQEWRDLGIDWIVTNPPFKQAHKIIPLAFEHTKVGLAALLRLNYLEPCKDRADWLKANSDHLCKIIILNPRPRFRSDTRNSDEVTVAWMVWRKDFSWNKLGVECPFAFNSGWNVT